MTLKKLTGKNKGIVIYDGQFFICDFTHGDNSSDIFTIPFANFNNEIEYEKAEEYDMSLIRKIRTDDVRKEFTSDINDVILSDVHCYESFMALYAENEKDLDFFVAEAVAVSGTVYELTSEFKIIAPDCF